jgi:hypothetical protein
LGASIENSRDEIEEALEKSPSLKNNLDELFERAYTRARRAAGAQIKLTRNQWESSIPARCPWPIERVLDQHFWPQRNAIAAKEKLQH